GGMAALAAAFALTRFFKINDVGAAPFVYSTSIVGGIALIASVFPAWRASLTSPMVAIRGETSSIVREAGVKVGRAVRELSETTVAAIVPLGTLIAEFAGSLRQVGSFS